MAIVYIIGHGDSKAQGLGGTYDRLGLPNIIAPGYNGQAYTAIPTVALSGGDGTGGHYTAALLGAGTYPPGGGITVFPDTTGTGYINIASPPTVTLSGGGTPTTLATFGANYAGGYYTQIERQLVAAGYNVKFINIARSGSGIHDLPPGANWVSDAGVELVKRLGAANCLFYFSTGINDASGGSPYTVSDWAGAAASVLSGYTALGVKVLANRTCDIVGATVAGITASQVTAANALLTQYNAALDTLQTNNPTTFKIITDEQTLMHGHLEWFGSNSLHPNDAGNLAIANDAVPKIAAYLRANFPAAGPFGAASTAANLSADGKTLALTLSLPVAGPGIASDFVLSNAAGVSASSLSADGLTLTLSLRRRIFAAENPTLTYAGTGIVGINKLPLQALTASAVTNGSTRRAFGPPAYLNVAYPGFTWPTVAGATGYRLYQNGILVYDTVNAAGVNTATSFTDPAATDGRPIDQPTFTVSAYDATGEGPQSGTPDGTAAALFTQGTTSVTLTDGAVVNGQTVQLSGPQRVVVNDVRYDVPVGVPVLLPNSIKSVLQNANLIA